ncbi:MAG: hypothetical protein RLN76_03810 [Phycisphaeraceae bacterium]
MNSNKLRWLMITWCVLWFAVILPGHKRGAIALPGEAQNAANVSFCPLCDLIKTSPDGNPLQPCSGGCLICHLKAGLNTPPPAMVFDPIIILLDDLPLILEPSQIDTIEPSHIIAGRAPPVV